MLAVNQPVLLALATLVGLAGGSFLNVVILRLPRRLHFEWRQQCNELLEQKELALEPPPDLVFTPSHCPQCKKRIRWYENIPVLSWLVLRGRCSGCGKSISFQYPVVELITGVLTVFLIAHYGLTTSGIAAVALTWGLIALSGIDLREQLLPDVIIFPLLWLGLLLNTQAMFTDLSSAVIGAVAGYMSLWIVFQLFRLLTGKEGMGYGDFKLLAMFGAWFGWQMLPLIVVLSSFVGAVVGIMLVVLRGRDRNIPIPFGPYLAAAGWIAMVWGDQLLAGYLGVSGIG
ncbi:MAG: A24 family peptidase [Xanthomonadales bacterium]|nr:A24 family peptidase [Xanthomonadales bacterium]